MLYYSRIAKYPVLKTFTCFKPESLSPTFNVLKPDSPPTYVSFLCQDVFLIKNYTFFKSLLKSDLPCQLKLSTASEYRIQHCGCMN